MRISKGMIIYKLQIINPNVESYVDLSKSKHKCDKLNTELSILLKSFKLIAKETL
jgi:hypothetical protein